MKAEAEALNAAATVFDRSGHQVQHFPAENTPVGCCTLSEEAGDKGSQIVDA